MRKYYFRLFKSAFTKSIGPIDLWMGLAGAILGIADHYWPAGQLMTALAWQIPVWTLATVIAVRLCLAPYWLAKEDANRIAALEAKYQNPDHKKQLAKFYVEAGELLSAFTNPLSMHSGSQRKAPQDAENFVAIVSAWIGKNMGPASQSRFLNLGSQGSEGDASEWKLKLRRQNLERLIEADLWD
jgi:hypothetical protein